MSRSVKKGPFVEARLLGRIEDMNKRNEKRVVKTWSRASTILPEFVGHTLAAGLRAGRDIDFLELGQDQANGAKRRGVAGAHGGLHRLVQLLAQHVFVPMDRRAETNRSPRCWQSK